MHKYFLTFLILFTASFGQVKVFTTVKPIADIVSAITGTKVDYLIPPSASLHTYEPKVSDLQKAYKSDLFVYIGSGEPDLSGLLEAIPEDRLVKVINIKGLKLIKEDHHVHPALWLDPDNAVIIARFIEKKLESINPENTALYRKNLQSFIRQVEAVKNYGREKIKNLPNKKFISYHYVWPYFTQAFGLEYTAVVEAGHGREPTPKHILKIINLIKKEKIKTIFAAVQFYNKKYGEMIKKQTGVKITFLDPFGINNNYTEMIRFNVEKVYQGLSGQ
ncbi:MAG: zinc ABC transporter substrate-binding protein [Aquificae bacterium]|nr:zinc ABC transporter substrate-binding protein [Aquificota bacterium]